MKPGIKFIFRYGPICGYYMGAKPVILVTDLRLLDKILCQEGQKFLDRPRRVPGGINPDPKRAEMLGNLEIPQWKTLRAILNKSFSPCKLQNMSAGVHKLVQVFMHIVNQHKNSSIDFYTMYQNLTLDLIGKAGFGIESDIQQNPDDALKAAVEQEFSKSTNSSLVKLYLCFPEVRWLLQPMRVIVEKLKQKFGLGGNSELWDLGLKTVLQRQLINLEAKRAHDFQPPLDLLNLMIESEKLTEISIVANSVLFFEAGFETLSASLAFITHLLMTHPNVQEEVRREISAVLKETGGHVDAHLFSKFTFLDAVIKEGLRMYPPQTTFIGRSGDEDLTHDYEWTGETVTCTIPKRVHLQVGLFQILNSSDIWEAPREFRPQRFLTKLTKEQVTAYQPFGKGRRICVGMKYADMVLKILLIQLFSKYKILPTTPNEPVEVELIYKTATMTPKKGVFGRVLEDPFFPAE